jgi:hypothetical protein
MQLPKFQTDGLLGPGRQRPVKPEAKEGITHKYDRMDVARLKEAARDNLRRALLMP